MRGSLGLSASPAIPYMSALGSWGCRLPPPPRALYGFRGGVAGLVGPPHRSLDRRWLLGPSATFALLSNSSLLLTCLSFLVDRRLSCGVGDRGTTALGVGLPPPWPADCFRGFTDSVLGRFCLFAVGVLAVFRCGRPCGWACRFRSPPPLVVSCALLRFRFALLALFGGGGLCGSVVCVRAPSGCSPRAARSRLAPAQLRRSPRSPG